MHLLRHYELRVKVEEEARAWERSDVEMRAAEVAATRKDYVKRKAEEKEEEATGPDPDKVLTAFQKERAQARKEYGGRPLSMKEEAEGKLTEQQWEEKAKEAEGQYLEAMLMSDREKAKLAAKRRNVGTFQYRDKMVQRLAQSTTADRRL